MVAQNCPQIVSYLTITSLRILMISRQKGGGGLIRDRRNDLLAYLPDAADRDRMSCLQKTVYLQINKEQVHAAICPGDCTAYLRRHARKRYILRPYNSRWTSYNTGYTFFLHCLVYSVRLPGKGEESRCFCVICATDVSDNSLGICLI